MSGYFNFYSDISRQPPPPPPSPIPHLLKGELCHGYVLAHVQMYHHIAPSPISNALDSTGKVSVLPSLLPHLLITPPPPHHDHIPHTPTHPPHSHHSLTPPPAPHATPSSPSPPPLLHFLTPPFPHTPPLPYFHTPITSLSSLPLTPPHSLTPPLSHQTPCPHSEQRRFQLCCCGVTSPSIRFWLFRNLRGSIYSVRRSTDQ